MVKKMAWRLRAIISKPDIVQSWFTWMDTEHVPDVLAAGAESGRLVRIDGDGPTVFYDIEYVFPSREKLEMYLQNNHPDLRVKGLRRFPPESGVDYVREAGVILATYPR